MSTKAKMLGFINSDKVINLPLPLDSTASELPEALHKIAVPFHQGSVKTLSQLSLLDEQSVPMSCGVKINAYWPDKSIKWVVLEFYNSNVVLVPSLEIRPFELVVEKPIAKFEPVISQEIITVELKSQVFTFNLKTSQFRLEQTDSSKRAILGEVEIRDIAESSLALTIKKHQLLHYSDLLDNSIHKTILSVELQCEPEKYQYFNVNLTFSFYIKQDTFSIEHTIHNTNAAKHPNGHWDLGDENTIEFSSANLVVTHTDKLNLHLQTQVGKDWQPLTNDDFKLLQSSSGGDNWQSPVHVDKNGQLPFDLKGAVFYQDNQTKKSIMRSTPSLLLNESLVLTVERFWQNFPKAIAKQDEKVIFALFPAQSKRLHELQAGESKTHKLWLAANSDRNALAWVHNQSNIAPPLEWSKTVLVDELTVIPAISSVFDELIQLGITGEDSFFQKREKLDEYGWRNFGDIYADHETAGYSGNDIFVSHYNNQYDPILGFLRQYLIKGEQKWFELADDLAKHVKNIDTYQTVQDKAEYNGGLFWHTDHYLQAYTSTHRSYSKYQSANAYQDHAGGGGPGGQHCYTTGLALHYLLTGDETSKQTVLSLANWISHVYEGSNTCFELLLALKNRHLLGVKNHFSGQYPLDRGTANYINAILDSFELSQDRSYLLKAEHIIQHTVHPNEDVSQRNLHDVETTWFYTVFLQSLTRYLSIKETLKELDEFFYYARDCLLNYANWMSQNEYLYLEKPEILEYPNDTWTAQDLRKAHIFAAAYFYAPDNYTVYLQKAEYFEREVAVRLNNCATKTYTRIMVLVLQNTGVLNFYKNRQKNDQLRPMSQHWPKAGYQNKSLAMGFISALCQRIVHISIKNEIVWLKKRLK